VFRPPLRYLDMGTDGSSKKKKKKKKEKA